MVKVGLIQMTAAQSVEQNMDKAISLIDAAAAKSAQIVCLQELFQSTYFCQTEDYKNFSLAEEISATTPIVNMLSGKAKEHEIVLIVPFFEKRAEGVYHNSVIVIDADGKYLGTYRKMHIPDDPHYYEKFYFTEGDLGYQVFKTRYASLCVMICWDQWYPEAARIAALKGAQIIFYPTAIGWLPEDKAVVGQAQHDAWETVQRAHAIANGCFIAAVNRVGFEASPDGQGGIEFWGQSFIVGPDGSIIAKASCTHEEIVLAEIDLAMIETTRVAWPFLRDRRIESYQGITERYLN
ncbi:MAG: carbon-nitrogen hydrolase [Candidatus Omnitrophica bacterium]|nr:carbon-nitrogen hydrolase [Candidatus Omnitrophota bacterium]